MRRSLSGAEIQEKCTGSEIYDMESLQCRDPSEVSKDCTENSIKGILIFTYQEISFVKVLELLLSNEK